MKVCVRAQVEVPRPRDEVFDFATSCEALPRFLKAEVPVPGIARAELIEGPRMRKGTRRRISLTDSTWLLEEIVAHERPGRHRYRWVTRPPLPFGLIVGGGEADWSFAESDGGTRVDWLYTFELSSPLAYPLALPFAALFRRWMARGLSRLEAEMRG
ncbi:MAG TPA: SRPBCC family protein [Anaeromyxobacteraceae bacterium]|nr:SRPBCC family protein [Anaeromyxobacteraceae bacterium]